MFRLCFSGLTSLSLLLALVGCGSDGASNDCDNGRCDEVDADGSFPESDGGSEEQPDAGPVSVCDGNLSFPDQWIQGGPDCGTEPEIQIHQLSDDTYVLRQSLCTSFEAPFMYLLFGEDKALLEDTGDGNIDIVGAVAGILAQEEAERGHDIELIVVNSHAHGDHTRGNAAFAQAGATMVGLSVDQIVSFFSMPGWPLELGILDLGGRQLDILGIPGHEDRHIAIYDHEEGLLLTGDTLYPGRLFINDFAQYKDSIAALVPFTELRETCHILGTHIELSTTPGDDYDFGVQHHPNEHELPLSRDVLLELNQALIDMGSTASRETHDDFIIFPL